MYIESESDFLSDLELVLCKCVGGMQQIKLQGTQIGLLSCQLSENFTTELQLSSSNNLQQNNSLQTTLT